VLKYLKTKYQIYLISNGIMKLQILRINHARIVELIDGFVFSEETMKPKPAVEYFDFLFTKYKIRPELEKLLIIGDSLTSDIQSGINLGCDTLWYNPNQLHPAITPTYQVSSLLEIINLL
jgi:2-haloacid dehalogenase